MIIVLRLIVELTNHHRLFAAARAVLFQALHVNSQYSPLSVVNAAITRCQANVLQPMRLGANTIAHCYLRVRFGFTSLNGRQQCKTFFVLTFN